jgi:pimeloyl-ACP methyl ester carboxylesterase
MGALRARSWPRRGQHHPEFAVDGDGERIPGANLAIVPNCGHLSVAEQPSATSGALVEWLRSKAF